MRRSLTSVRVSIVAGLLAAALFLPALYPDARPLPAYADDGPTPTPTASPTPDNWGGDSDGDNG